MTELTPEMVPILEARTPEVALILGALTPEVAPILGALTPEVALIQEAPTLEMELIQEVVSICFILIHRQFKILGLGTTGHIDLFSLASFLRKDRCRSQFSESQFGLDTE